MGDIGIGKGAEKKEKKANVSFAFTHTYTLKKEKKNPFFHQAYMNNFEKCAKTPTKSRKGGRGATTAPCGQDTIPYGSKPLL